VSRWKAVERMATQLVFGRIPAQRKARQRWDKSEVKVLYFRNLFDAEEDDGKPVLPPAEQPVKLAMFAW